MQHKVNFSKNKLISDTKYSDATYKRQHMSNKIQYENK